MADRANPVPSPKPGIATAWPIAFLLVGLAAFPLTRLLIVWPSLSIQFDRYGGAERVVAVVVLLAAAFARRAIWRASLGVAVLASILSAVLFPRFLGAVEAPYGTEMMPRDFMRAMPPAYVRILHAQEADLALLSRGEREAVQGRPLAAPEGGFLVPVDRGVATGYESSLRYESVSMAPPAEVWPMASARVRTKIAESRAFLNLRPSTSPTPWLVIGLIGLGKTLGLAVAANLLALLSRTLLGEPR